MDHRIKDTSFYRDPPAIFHVQEKRMQILLESNTAPWTVYGSPLAGIRLSRFIQIDESGIKVVASEFFV